MLYLQTSRRHDDLNNREGTAPIRNPVPALGAVLVMLLPP